MSIWQRALHLKSEQDIWRTLASDLSDPRVLSSGKDGIWGLIAIPPGGLWRELQDDTLILRQSGDNLWLKALREPLLEHSDSELYDLFNQAFPSADETHLTETGLWDRVSEETLVLARTTSPVWEFPQAHQFANFKPQRATGYALKELQSSSGEAYWVLKNLNVETAYLRLDEQQYYLWNLLDGAHSVQDLAVANFMKFGNFSVEWLAGFLGQLQSKGFLISKDQDVYQGADEHIKRRSVWHGIKQVGRKLFQSEFGLPVDGFYGTLYKYGARVLFTLPVQVFLLILTLMGLPAYFIATRSGGGRLILADAGLITIVSLFLAQIFSFFIHESAHALTTKHYGRQLRRGGVGLYFGMVAFYIDTTDIWMEPRNPRLAVTWAGPYSMFVMGSAASLALLLLDPASVIWVVGYQFALFCYVNALFNLNPLIKLDGYYLLMDWLEIPMLRERSIKFVRHTLWEKIKAREKLDREEWLFTVFGLLALLWMIVMIFLVIRLYGKSIVSLF